MMDSAVVAGKFDETGSETIRFIHEASNRTEDLYVALLSDELIEQIYGSPPRHALAERKYFVANIRYVDGVCAVDDLEQLGALNSITGRRVSACYFRESDESNPLRDLIGRQGIECFDIAEENLAGFPPHDYERVSESAPKVIVTGCFDWFHTGHLTFFEEASGYGDLYVILGNDRNIGELKGKDHPMFSEDERKYIAGAMRFVKRAMISSGSGWLDAEPEIQKLKPDRYLVNEDGDKDVKRRYCEEHGIEYLVLKRTPKEGLPRRTSTDLRGF